MSYHIVYQLSLFPPAWSRSPGPLPQTADIQLKLKHLQELWQKGRTVIAMLPLWMMLSPMSRDSTDLFFHLPGQGLPGLCHKQLIFRCCLSEWCSCDWALPGRVGLGAQELKPFPVQCQEIPLISFSTCVVKVSRAFATNSWYSAETQTLARALAKRTNCYSDAASLNDAHVIGLFHSLNATP